MGTFPTSPLQKFIYKNTARGDNAKSAMNINKKEVASKQERERERGALNMYKNRKSETKQNEFYLTFWVKFQFFFLSARNIEINIGPQR